MKMDFKTRIFHSEIRWITKSIKQNITKPDKSVPSFCLFFIYSCGDKSSYREDLIL